MKLPTLRKHATGQWFVFWGGKNHYLGMNQDIACKGYLESLDEWRKWRPDRAQAVAERNNKSPRIKEIHDAFIRAKTIEGGNALGTYYTKHLKRYLGQTGDINGHLIRPKHLQA